MQEPFLCCSEFIDGAIFRCSNNVNWEWVTAASTADLPEEDEGVIGNVTFTKMAAQGRGWHPFKNHYCISTP